LAKGFNKAGLAEPFAERLHVSFPWRRGAGVGYPINGIGVCCARATALPSPAMNCHLLIRSPRRFDNVMQAGGCMGSRPAESTAAQQGSLD
jgi:hypothetical protein